MQRIKSLWRYLPVLLLLALSACSHNPYTITFNDNVMYSPNKALLNSIVTDPSLQGCINQVLATMESANAAEIKLLACPDAGIKSLEGINALSALEQLELSDNLIDNLSPLSGMRNLRVLSIRNNAISNIGPLDSLPLLRFISLTGNNRISCRQLEALVSRLGNTLSRPATCIE